VEEVPPPSSVRSEIPPALDAVLASALQKQPDERMATAIDLAEALDAVRAGEKLTLPHGSRWPSKLPPAREEAARAAATSDDVETKVRGDDRASSPRNDTTLESEGLSDSTASGTVLMRPGHTAKAAPPRRRWAALIGAAATVAVAAALWAWPRPHRTPEKPRPAAQAPMTSAAVTAEASASSRASASPTPAPSLAPSAAPGTIPTTAPTRLPPPPPAPAPSPTNDFATPDELPL
jgi:serine/threonine-protein kinase